MAINFKTDLGDSLDLGKKYETAFKDGLKITLPAKQEVKPSAIYQYPLDADVNHQDIYQKVMQHKDVLAAFSERVRTYLETELGPVSAFRN